MKRLFLILAVIGMVMAGCTESNTDDTPNTPTEQPGEGGEPTDPTPDEPGEGEGGEPTEPGEGDEPGEGEGGEPTEPGEGDGGGDVPTVPEDPMALPADPNPASTAFHHRILLVEHTGVDCVNCPRVMDGLVELAKTEWHDYYVEVTCHGGSYAPADKDNAFSLAASDLDSFYSPKGYPAIHFNLQGGVGDINSGDAFVVSNTKKLEALVNKSGAEAGISAASTSDATSVNISVGVKAAVEKEYYVMAWLLEDNIQNSQQLGGSKDYHYVSNNAVRALVGASFGRRSITVDALGAIAVGKVATKQFSFTLDAKWNSTNMKVAVIVCAMNSSSKPEVVNVAVCPINGKVAYEYVVE